MLSNTTFGWGHFIAAALALLAGAVQVFRTKGDSLHRRIGYLYVCSLLVADVCAFGVYQFTGRFTIFHAGAVLNAGCLFAGIAPFISSRRPDNWRVRHAIWLGWSYVGLWAAGLTELVIRTIHWSSRSEVLGVTALISALATAIGIVLTRRMRKELAQFE